MVVSGQPKGLKELGERIFNLQRVFNVMAGFTKRTRQITAKVPQRDSQATTAQKTMPKEEFSKALEEYYSFRGWDVEGRPTKKN